MPLPTPPIAPMLARLAHELPRGGGWLYEPKWDGFRCLAFVSGGEVDLRSRHDRRLARYFPDLVEALRGVATARFVLDGEIVVAGARGLDFPALLSRVHPSATRVERLQRETPASLVAFDLLAACAEDLRERPFVERRARLESLLRGAPPALLATPVTSDPLAAEGWLARFEGAGIDGVVAKHRDLPYLAGRRAMVKVKHEHTADCVVAGLRLVTDSRAVASLLLGLYEDGELRHVGVSSSFPEARRVDLVDELRPWLTTLEGHPWERGFNIGRSPTGRLAGSAGRWDPASMSLDWMPLAPERVAEVAFDQLDVLRLRHPARFLRWRPDRDARSCTFDQLAVAPPDLAALLGDA